MWDFGIRDLIGFWVVFGRGLAVKVVSDGTRVSDGDERGDFENYLPQPSRFFPLRVSLFSTSVFRLILHRRVYCVKSNLF